MLLCKRCGLWQAQTPAAAAAKVVQLLPGRVALDACGSTLVSGQVTDDHGVVRAARGTETEKPLYSVLSWAWSMGAI